MRKQPVLTLLGGAVVGAGGQGFVDQRWVALGVGVSAFAVVLSVLHASGMVVQNNDLTASDKSVATAERAHALSVESLTAGCLEVRVAIVECLEGRKRSPKSFAEIRYFHLHVCEIETTPGVTTEALAALIRDRRVGRVNKAGQDHGKFFLR